MSKNKPEQKQPVQQPLPSRKDTWLDLLGVFWLRFERFGRDFLGIILLTTALITLLGFLGLTQGNIMNIWLWALKRWLGWGQYLAILVLAVIGLRVIWRYFSSITKIPLGRILALEGLFFCLLTFFTVLGGRSVIRADQGLDGGLIGWGLATLFNDIFPEPIVPILLIFGLIIFGLYGFGISGWFINKFEGWLVKPLGQQTGSATGGNRFAGDQNKQKGSKAGLQEDEDGEVGSIPSAVRDDRLPPLNLLMQEQTNAPDEEDIHATAEQIEKTLMEFGFPCRVVGFRVGPTVTQFAIEPGFIEKPGPDGQPLRQKVRVSQISALSRDLALALSAERLRIEAPVPGRSFVGIEVPNQKISVVRLRSLLESDTFQRLSSQLGIVLGRDVSGQPVVVDLARMPHVLIAGTTGSGKSVCIAALTVCLVMNNTPDELRLAMMDPKMVELIRFNGLPHLLGKVETEVDRMLGMLQWALTEMDNRYKLLEGARARDLEAYNRKAERRKQPVLPRIVVLIDELADLMMSAPDQTEHSLVRLAQMARATGIHLVLATQRPSTDVVTGLIKANFPARISFNVASSIDSRVILDSNGAETLMGRGDMLFLNPEVGTPQRAQGVMVTDNEIMRVVSYWQKTVTETTTEAPWEELMVAQEDGPDDLLKQAITIVRQSQRASASLIQRRLHVGYPRAARLIDELEKLGVIGPAQGGGREREVLWSKEDVDLGKESDPDEDDL